MTVPPDPAVNLTVSRRTVRRAGYGVAGVIALVAVALIFVAVLGSLSSRDSLATEVNSSDYQAVFLANNEVYFGKLSVPSGSFCYLRHVYRLTVQPSARKGQPLRRTLVKLISDVHSPEDLLVINRSQIVYVENLNPSGSAARLLNKGGP